MSAVADASGSPPDTLWLNPVHGVAGDMLLGALLGLGAPLAEAERLLGHLDVPGWRLEVGDTTRRGLTATAVEVHAPDHDHHRPWSRIDALLAGAGLPGPVTDGARRTFRALAEAEARVHGVAIDDVHFHEVGAVDAIVDVVGTWAAWHLLGGPRVVVAPIGLGTGTAAMAHGAVPVPAPAVLELLAGHPTVPVEVDRETATPTGVALLVTMADAWGHLPAGVVAASARGAGRWDPPTHPNVVTAVLTRTATTAAPTATDLPPNPAATVTRGAVMVETNVDDVTAEVLAHVVDRLLSAGADDAWVVPVTMKKGRAAHTVRVLCRPDVAATVRNLLTAETGTLGLRQWDVTKHELPRRTEVVTVDGHEVRVKVGPHGAKAEFDDAARVAAATGRSVRDVSADAAGRALRGPAPGA
ncbi:MAG: nickel pincer cofactor biosynthesis protein LarC [Microthrixaceae bacterium]